MNTIEKQAIQKIEDKKK